MSINQTIKTFQSKIQETYESGITLDQAERFASELLGGMLGVSTELSRKDLDARMKKTAIKALRAALYENACKGHEKKPTEGTLTALLDSNELIIGEQNRLDEAEVEVLELKRTYDIFNNAHVHYRNVSKGAFGG